MMHTLPSPSQNIFWKVHFSHKMGQKRSFCNRVQKGHFCCPVFPHSILAMNLSEGLVKAITWFSEYNLMTLFDSIVDRKEWSFPTFSQSCGLNLQTFLKNCGKSAKSIVNFSRLGHKCYGVNIQPLGKLPNVSHQSALCLVTKVMLHFVYYISLLKLWIAMHQTCSFLFSHGFHYFIAIRDNLRIIKHKLDANKTQGGC